MGNIESEQSVLAPQTEMFTKDGRKTLDALYSSYDLLCQHGWKKELICSQKEIGSGVKTRLYPVFGYLSPLKKDQSHESLWILSGIHGEEPAGPNAIAEEINTIKKIAKSGIPTVLIPLINPLGYSKDYRYLNSKRETDTPQYMTASDHLLSDKENPERPRSDKPANAYSEQILNWAVEKIHKFPPYLVIDHHEDEIEWETKAVDHEGSYCYAYGNPKAIESSCKKIAQTLNKHGVPLLDNFETRYHERTSFGFLFNVSDNSIDEFLAAPSFYWKGEHQLKPAAKAVFVIETTRDDTKPILLVDREKAHQEIIKSYKILWDLVHVSSPHL